MMNSDMMAVRNYVTAQDHIHAKGLVVDITHSNLQQRHLEIPFEPNAPVSELQFKIYQQTGTLVEDQLLYVIENDTVVAEMVDPRRPIAYYIYKNVGLTVHCVDTNPHSISSGGALEDTSLVPKFRLSDEAYEKKTGTVRDWKQNSNVASYRQHLVEHQGVQTAQRQYKLGKGLPLGYKLNEAGKVARDEDAFNASSVAHIVIGSRCEIRPGGRRGVVACNVPSIPTLGKGYWVGIILDEPVGKHNGTIADTTYFEAPTNCGIFCRGHNVSVGEEYTERDILDDSDDEL